MQATSSANAAALQSAITQAKSLEYDEDKHYAMIRFLKQLFGVTGIWASFLFSLIIIGTFEYAFHFVGAYVADHKRALLLLGRDSQGVAWTMAIQFHRWPPCRKATAIFRRIMAT
ncbi:MAG: hypothetical protein R3E89_02435 [Thiolinea sp.]